MDDTFKKNIENLKFFFKDKKNKESKYLAIIQKGKALPFFPEYLKIKKNQVNGCQSITYISSKIKDDLIEFIATSDSLFSKGLAAILIEAYKKVNIETLNIPPKFLYELKINLSPNRANGLLSIYEKMKEKANLEINNLKINNLKIDNLNNG